MYQFKRSICDWYGRYSEPEEHEREIQIHSYRSRLGIGVAEIESVNVESTPRIEIVPKGKCKFDIRDTSNGA